MKNKNTRKNKGFTLIELLVVMAIISVLFKFIVPKINVYREKAERLRAIDVGRQIYFATVDSYSENNGEFDNGKITENINTLLGLNNVDVSNSTDNNVTVSYKIDNKNYSMNFNDTENNFIIKNEGKQIYPVSNSKKVLNENNGGINSGD